MRSDHRTVRSGSSGNSRHQSGSQLHRRTHTLPPSPSAARSRNSEPIEKLRRGQPAALEPWTKEYHIYRTGSSWSAQISWGKCFAFGELAQINKSINQVNCCGNLVIDRRLNHFRMDYPSLYMCKSKRGIKREDGGKVRVLALLFCVVTEFSYFKMRTIRMCVI